MPDLIQFISSIGFPIAVAAFLLVRVESKLSEVGKSVDRVGTQIEVLAKAIDGLVGHESH